MSFEFSKRKTEIWWNTSKYQNSHTGKQSTMKYLVKEMNIYNLLPNILEFQFLRLFSFLEFITGWTPFIPAKTLGSQNYYYAFYFGKEIKQFAQGRSGSSDREMSGPVIWFDIPCSALRPRLLWSILAC